jgi:hypothetical protein
MLPWREVQADSVPPGRFLTLIAMPTTFAPSPVDSYTSRFRFFSGRYDSDAHLRWVLSQPEVRGRLEYLGDQAANPRRYAGLAWREYAVDDVRGDSAAIERWHGEHRRLSEFLPPKLRPFVALLSRSLDAPIEIPGSRALPGEDVTRLQSICRQKLDDDSGPLSGADRSFLFKRLRQLDPPGEPMIRVAGADVAVGVPVAVSATGAALGSWVLHEVKPGFPVIGVAATSSGKFTEVVPYSLPPPRMQQPPMDDPSDPHQVESEIAEQS